MGALKKKLYGSRWQISNNDGSTDGVAVGAADGVNDGFTVGVAVGLTDGVNDGSTEGVADGANEGFEEGVWL